MRGEVRHLKHRAARFGQAEVVVPRRAASEATTAARGLGETTRQSASGVAPTLASTLIMH